MVVGEIKAAKEKLKFIKNKRYKKPYLIHR